MLKIIFVALCLIAAFCGSSSSTNIECEYDSSVNYYIVGHIYRCKVNNNPNIISEESAQISGVSGTHLNSSYSNDDVLGFRAEWITMRLRKIESVDTKLTVVSKTVDDGQKKINKYFEDVKSSQCGLKSPFIDLKSSQDSIQTSLNSLKLTTDDQGSKLDHIQKYQNQLISLHAPQSTSINNIVAKLNEYDKTQKNHGAVLSDIKSLQNDTNAVIRELKLSHDSTRTFQDFSLINITSKLNDLNKNIKSSQDDIKLSNSEIVAILSDHTMVHIEAKNSFTKIQTVQNEIKKSLNDLSAKVNNEVTDKFTSLTDKFTSLSDKVESLEPHLIEFEGKMDDKLVRIEKELSNKLHRMSGALCLIAAFCGSSSSTNIECRYRLVGYNVLGDIYECNVNSNPNIISEESAQISGVSGTHEDSKTNDDVLGFRADSKTIEVFPKGLDKIFKNIKLIKIERCQLKEIHQSDLKGFPNLIYFYLLYNKIEIIEEGLFDYNPNLEVVGFYESNIIHIDPNAFDNLSKLSYFWFYHVPCVGQDISNSKEQVQSAIKVVKSKCTDADFLSLDTQLKNLESESKTLNSEAFKAKLGNLEKSIQNSKFFKFRPLNYKVQNLKTAFNSAQIQKTQIPDKLEDLKSPQCGPVDDLKVSMDTFQFTMSESISKLGKEITSISPKVTEIQKYQNTVSKELTLNSGLKNIIGKLEDVKSSQCGLKSPFIDLKSSQDSIQTSLNSLKLTTDGQGTKLNDLTDKFTSLTDKFKSLTDKVESLESIEPHLIKFEGKIDDKFVRIEKELSNKLHRMSLSFDEKFKGIETRLVKKIEKILEEKLANVLQFF
ncbi:putative leucine-rich repeat-containing protein DDB_G0290503 [Chironomus tepperi]|uniref:putative leucine-rich repeat-containing protein DDB_G0290503 n=1 Tax=Chironomus tepperi TaxID=113505 RepID=UPI00391F0E84